MKRIVCIILAVLFCLSFAACGKSGDTATKDTATKDSAVSSAASSADDTAETVAEATRPAVSSDTSSAAGGNTATKMFASVEDYLNNEQVQESIQKQLDNSTDSSIKMDVYAEGDTLVYDYTFTQNFSESELATVKSSLDSSLENTSGTFSDVVKELKTYVNVENPKAKVIYRNSDGTEITERIYE